MARGLDHIVHAVRDLDAAAALYRRMGFTVGARNRHPPAWGTENHIVQLPGTFVELLTVVAPEGIVAHTPNVFSFGAFNRDFLAQCEGLSMLALEGKGADDAAAFRDAGIGDFDLYEFEREAKRPDGSATKVAFTLAFARDQGSPAIGFFTARHDYPENFWNPAFQVHANGAKAVAGVIIAAARPSNHRDFIKSFSDAAAVRADGNALTVTTPRGDIVITDPVGFARRLGTNAPPVKDGARLAGLRIKVADLEATEELLRTANVAFASDAGRLVIGAGTALGAIIVFEEGE
jgi:hypothetical protein